MEIRRVPISKLNPAPYNSRKDLKPGDSEYQKLVRSLDEFGCIEPLVWNRRTGILVGGHQRLKILVAQGARHVDVSVVDLPAAKEKALNLALNKISGDWDQTKLAELLDDLTKLPKFDLELTGFDQPEVDELLARLERDRDGEGGSGDGEENFDVDGELAIAGPAVTRRGDLIELGTHRLLCGDATRSDDWDRLVGNTRVRLLFSDPPYNVDYSGENRPTRPGSAKPGHRKNASRKRWDRIQADHMPAKRYAAWFEKFVANASAALAPGGAFYIWNGHRNFGLMAETLIEEGLRPACVITWAKESFSPGFGDYNEQLEFCLYGWKTGARHSWYGPKNESTLWQVHRDRTKNYHHPTQKALELAERAIRNSSKPNDLVLDPFLGSGTTLIAAARLGRKCAGIEIEPKYCDVIVRRFISLVGEKVVPRAIAKKYRREKVEAGS